MFKTFPAMFGAGCLCLGIISSGAQAASLSGAGATFPAPLYQKWAERYHAETGTSLNYQAIGSGGGIKQIKAQTVDFGASDKPLKPDELAAAGLYQFPTVVGGVVPIVHIPGVGPGQLKLSGAVLADIFLGRITRWNDPRIAALNPGLRLGRIPITVVHRSDGSGTSFLFTTYLSKKSPLWARQVGASDAVSWPAGIGGKGNDGVAAFVKQTFGAIGYIEYAVAKQVKASHVLLQNSDGRFVGPGAANFSAAASGAQWARSRNNYMLLIDQPGARSWPITAVTFILLRRNQSSPTRGRDVLRFFDWAYRTGDKVATDLSYVPLPASVKTMVRSQWPANVRSAGKPVYVAR